ncbi:hypothetical protein HKD28_15100 [Gluconobacter sp. LMG 1744]|uniref:hypothetical protein n=1 Tax=Gluconobacter cadivus TaxID=2728101 RepID=UPI0018854C7C|nr:hypothetical protein [Gluconobacter cadivus]MBF0892718.1 hypothetical protein [Gluconobacter cadivus]
MKYDQKNFKNHLTNFVGASILCGATYAHGTGTRVPTSVYSFGPTISCMNIIKVDDANDKEDVRRFQIDSYVGGLLSGLNYGEVSRLMATRKSDAPIKVAIGEKSSYEWRKSWIHTYCIEHPDDHLVDAVVQLWQFMRDHHVGEVGTDSSH